MRIEIIEELGDGTEVRHRPAEADLHVILEDGTAYGPYASQVLADEGLAHHGPTARVLPLFLPITDREYDSDRS